MESNKRQKLQYTSIGILLFIGIIATIYLAIVYYDANFNQYSLGHFCTVNDFIDCDGVARTTESQFLGIPLAYWGLFLYSFITMLLFVDKLKKIPFLKFLEVFKNKFHYIASLGLIAFIISMSLLCISLFVIHKLCVVCALTYILNLVIGLIAAIGIKGNFIGAIKQSWIDFTDALKPIPYRVAFIIVMLCACGFLGWAYTSAKFAPSLTFERNFGEFVRAKTNKYAVKGNILGSDAKDAVVLKVFSDYKCPMCYACNIMIHKLAMEFKNLRVEHHALPLDTSCNKYLKEEFHHGSCIMAQYAEAAGKQNKFWEVHSLFFDKKPTTEDEVIDVLKKSGLGIDIEKIKKDAHSPEVNKIIQDDIDYAISHKQIGTPAIQLGDEFEMGVKGYPEFKEWIKKHGGEPKGLF